MWNDKSNTNAWADLLQYIFILSPFHILAPHPLTIMIAIIQTTKLRNEEMSKLPGSGSILSTPVLDYLSERCLVSLATQDNFFDAGIIYSHFTDS